MLRTCFILVVLLNTAIYKSDVSTIGLFTENITNKQLHLDKEDENIYSHNKLSDGFKKQTLKESMRIKKY